MLVLVSVPCWVASTACIMIKHNTDLLCCQLAACKHAGMSCHDDSPSLPLLLMQDSMDPAPLKDLGGYRRLQSPFAHVLSTFWHREGRHQPLSCCNLHQGQLHAATEQVRTMLGKLILHALAYGAFGKMMFS